MLKTRELDHKSHSPTVDVKMVVSECKAFRNYLAIFYKKALKALTKSGRTTLIGRGGKRHNAMKPLSEMAGLPEEQDLPSLTNTAGQVPAVFR